MDDIIVTSEGDIDWNANGWPAPNAACDPNYEGYSTEGMPDEVFDIWQEACDEEDIEWSADY